MNHTELSGPETIFDGLLAAVGSVNVWAIAPPVVIAPIWLPDGMVNQMFPSGPEVVPPMNGLTTPVGAKLVVVLLAFTRTRAPGPATHRFPSDPRVMEVVTKLTGTVRTA